ncbi:hypothetical protein [Curtobacterium aurantiacum]|uniref:hypothetical protein n=1 Tax=Curtobacterium aurantiacum TaxID=3236919 RepID=UPI001BE0ED43|nr:hypothetical protein [Curtobacterium flaccumfaciens]MBT1676002.1 hypothetical protein [Curtobacterium flaccumfaciens pv. flaccumfaciens]
MAILTAQTFTLTVAGTRLDPVGNRMVVTMDEGNSPWLTAEATVRRPSDAVMALLEPDRRSPVVLTLAAPASLTLRFTVQGREFAPESDTVALTLVSDEYPLLTYAPSTPVDLRAKSYQASARAIAAKVVSTALGRATAVELAAGTADQSFTTYAAAQNLIPNPDVTTLNTYAGSSTPAAQFSFDLTPYDGVNYAAATGLSQVTVIQVGLNQGTVSASPGTTYTASVLMRATSGSNVTGTLILQFTNEAGTVVSQSTKGLGLLKVLVNQQTDRVSITGTCPEGATSVRLVARGSSSSRTSIAVGKWMITEGDGLETDGTSLMTWFAGDSVPGTTGYVYGWDGAANNSSSTRTPVVDREPESLLWKQTDVADDFLRPILESIGMRLFQNEAGTFVLADNGYKVPGQVVMQHGSTLYGGQESSSVLDDGEDGFPLNADAVIVTYAWTDALGRARTATDFAKAGATYSRPYVLEKTDTPYPGPGQAKFLLARLLARKRQIDTVGRPDWSARPGMSAVVSLPHRPTATGYVQALVFDLSAATMTVTTKGLVTTPPGSIGNAPITQTIGSVAGTIAAYTN